MIAFIILPSTTSILTMFMQNFLENRKILKSLNKNYIESENSSSKKSKNYNYFGENICELFQNIWLMYELIRIWAHIKEYI